MERIRRIIRNTDILNDFLKRYHLTGERFLLKEFKDFNLHLFIGEEKGMRVNTIVVKKFNGKTTIEFWISPEIKNTELNRIKTYRMKNQSGVKKERKCLKQK